MFGIIFSFLTILFLLLDSTAAQTILVPTSDGIVEGIQGSSQLGTPYYAFYSIRYAKPPVGELRFQAPVPVDPWNDIYDATAEKYICYQVASNSDVENEDCLTLSVFTPLTVENKTNSSVPVMVFIHGGGFINGAGQSRMGYRPGYFMDNNVVVVTINYRLGAFGFMSTGDVVMPGNYGLKDQVLALKWIKNNIVSFGGDPSRITIFGESAGGASVGYQILSAQSAGLFSAAILQSGTALCPWAYQRNQTEITYQTASFIKSDFYAERDSQKLLEFLRSVDAETIDTAAENYTHWALSFPETGYFGVANSQLEQGFFYSPVIEVEHSTAFLTKKQYEAFNNGDFNQIPIFIGANSEEGLINFDDNLQWLLSAYDHNPDFLVPQGIHITNETTKVNIGNQIKQNYSPDSKMKDNLLSGIQYYTDQDFQKSIIKHAEFQANYSDVYFYMFSYSGEMGGNKNQRYPGALNVTHGEELAYIFEMNNPKNYPEQDQIVHERLVKLWVNFATYHNPTPSKDALLQNITWPKFIPDNLSYVDIGTDLIINVNPKKEKYQFWDKLFKEYGVEPFDTF